MNEGGGLASLLLPPDADDLTAIVELAEVRRSVTYGELRQMSASVGNSLRGEGVEPGCRVGIIGDNGIDYVAVLLGVLRVGAVPVPLSTRFTRSDIAAVLEDADPSLVLAAGDYRHLVDQFPTVLGFDAALATAATGFTAHAVAPTDDALQLYTSGSTGRPKGVVLSHGSQVWSVRTIIGDHRDRSVAATTLVAAPLYHKNGLLISKVVLTRGCRLVLLPRFDARRYLDAVDQERCEVLSGVPTMFAMLVREQAYASSLDLSSVSMISMGSAPLTQALAEAVERMFPMARIVNNYGATEASLVFGDHPDGIPRPSASVGYPIKGVSVRLVGGRSDNEGELWIQSPGQMTGYHNMGDLTAAKVSDGWYRTGDVMSVDADGFYYHMGRADDMFVCGGENVYPAEVEGLLEQHPAVVQAAVVPLADTIKGHVPVAFVVLAAGSQVSEDELKQYCLAHGPAYRHPRHVAIEDRLPLSGTEKVDRRELRHQAEQRFVSGSHSG